MRALLVVAHGSRRAASNDEVRALTEQIRSHATKQFDYIGSAFLELAEPSIPDGLKQCIEQGATEVVVLPYFLSAGRHVVEDIPDEVAKVTALFPKVSIHIAPYLGTAPDLPETLVNLAAK